MANTFYHNSFTGLDATLAASGALNAEYESVESGLAQAQAIYANAVRVATPDSLIVMPVAASRVNKAIIFDGAGEVHLHAMNDLAQPAAAVMGPMTASSSYTNIAPIGTNTVVYTRWNDPIIQSSGVPAWVKNDLAFLGPFGTDSALTPPGLANGFTAGIHLVKYSCDMETVSIVPQSEFSVSIQAGGLNSGVPSFNRTFFNRNSVDDWFNTATKTRINIQAPVFLYGDGASGLWIRHDFTDAVNDYVITNAQLSVVRIAFDLNSI